MAAIIGYRPYAVPQSAVGDAHVHHIHARVGAFSPNAQLILPVAAMAGAVGIFGGVLWGFKGVLLGATLGASLGLAATHLGELVQSQAAGEKKP